MICFIFRMTSVEVLKKAPNTVLVKKIHKSIINPRNLIKRGEEEFYKRLTVNEKLMLKKGSEELLNKKQSLVEKYVNARMSLTEEHVNDCLKQAENYNPNIKILNRTEKAIHYYVLDKYSFYNKNGWIVNKFNKAEVVKEVLINSIEYIAGEEVFDEFNIVKNYLTNILKKVKNGKLHPVLNNNKYEEAIIEHLFGVNLKFKEDFSENSTGLKYELVKEVENVNETAGRILKEYENYFRV